MQVKTIIAFALVALSATVMADFDDDLWPALVWANIIGNGQQTQQTQQRQQQRQRRPRCASYGTACSATRPCCQYLGHVEMSCFNGQCLQSVCGYPGQECGPFIGECCYHLNLQCQGNGFSGSCVAASQG